MRRSDRRGRRVRIIVILRVGVIVQAPYEELQLLDFSSLLQGQNKDTAVVLEPDDLALNIQGYQLPLFPRHAIAQLGLNVLDDAQDFREQRNALEFVS